MQSTLNQEGKILLAMRDIKNGQIKSVRSAASQYEIPLTTLRRRLQGTTSRRDSTPNNMRLTPKEEEVIVKYVINLDSKGFPPKLENIRDMANSLLEARSAAPVGERWPNSFVRRKQELKTRFIRRYDYQKAKCEDSAALKAWFDLVSSTIAQHGIDEADIWNFDETGFAMGLICRCLVVTGSERRGNPKKTQPGNRNWTTAIACVSAAGDTIPPYIIFKGQEHSEGWFSDEIPRNWAIGVSKRGWTNNEHGLSWLKHFNQHTIDRTRGVYRLLIVDGHESHMAVEFNQYCEENKIIPLCMPAHASHYLQPLDVGCFGPLKKAYGFQIERLSRCNINLITPADFLPAFYQAWTLTMKEDTIKGSFRGSGIVPLDASVVLDKLEVIRTPSPQLPNSSQNSIWEPHTPHTQQEFAFQTEIINPRMLNIPGSSPQSIDHYVGQLARGAEALAASVELMKAEIANLRKAIRLISARKSRKKTRITGQLVLTVKEALFRISGDQVVDQIRREDGAEGVGDGTRIRTSRRCGICREAGHRRETCKLRVINT